MQARITTRTTVVLWAIPLLLHSEHSLAWGLYTHLYFSQLLLWAFPLADPALCRLARTHARWLLTGACLPDLALMSRPAGTKAFHTSHRWQSVSAQWERAQTDEERAVVIGFASHLLVDVVAHNHFVPAHERMWLDLPMATHALAEWAMDSHLESTVYARPGDLLRKPPHWLVRFISAQFGSTAVQTRRACEMLGQADCWLRASRIPALAYAAARRIDRRLEARFDRYIMETAPHAGQIERLLHGEAPGWQADVPRSLESRTHLAGYRLDQLREYTPVPADLFALQPK
jgi:Zinc dependent phospholipase C